MPSTPPPLSAACIAQRSISSRLDGDLRLVLVRMVVACRVHTDSPKNLVSWTALSLKYTQIHSPKYSPSTRIRLLTPRRRPSHNRARAIRREVLIKHTPIPIRLLRIRHVASPLLLRVLHLLIGDHLLCRVLERIDPAISDTITELLLLAPEDVVGKVGIFGGVCLLYTSPSPRD